MTTTATTSHQQATTQELRHIYRDLHKKEGREKANQETLDSFLVQFMQLLDDDTNIESVLPRISNRIAAAINENLSIRDSLLATSLDGTVEHESLIDFASRPHEQKNVSKLYHILERAYNNPAAPEALNRSGNAARYFEIISNRQENDDDTVQPLACAAYLSWLDADNRHAQDLAERCLAIEPDVTLASITLSAIKQCIRAPRA